MVKRIPKTLYMSLIGQSYFGLFFSMYAYNSAKSEYLLPFLKFRTMLATPCHPLANQLKNDGVTFCHQNEHSLFIIMMFVLSRVINLTILPRLSCCYWWLSRNSHGMNWFCLSHLVMKCNNCLMVARKNKRGLDCIVGVMCIFHPLIEGINCNQGWPLVGHYLACR